MIESRENFLADGMTSQDLNCFEVKVAGDELLLRRVGYPARLVREGVAAATDRLD